VLESAKQGVGALVADVGGVAAGDAGMETVGKEPKPVVPRPVAPRPFVPRPAMPRPAASTEEAAVAAVAVPKLDEGEVELALEIVVVPELEEFTIPELLTELHGAGVPGAGPTALGSADIVELGERLMPPPSNVGNAAAPGFSMEQGVGFTPAE
jgi:hypothetical protein